MWNGVIVACILSMNSAGEKVCDYTDSSKFIAGYTNRAGTGSSTKEACEKELNAVVDKVLKPRMGKTVTVAGNCSEQVAKNRKDIVDYAAKHIFAAAKKAAEKAK